jgi:hypothetical protein
VSGALMFIRLERLGIAGEQDRRRALPTELT